MQRDATTGAIGLVAIGGVLMALLSAVPVKRLTREERAAQVTRAEASAARSRAHIGQLRQIDRVFASDAKMAKALLIADQHQFHPKCAIATHVPE
jgi:hypothetical protein